MDCIPAMEIGKDYNLLEKISDSRHSVVYRAKHKQEGTYVIIKFLRSNSPSESELIRFKQEYETIKKLDLPGVITIHDLIHFDEGIALVLEDFDALSLKDCIAEGELDLEAFFEVSISLSKTLGEMHQRGVIHRDIKPANILVGHSWRDIRITDFGISQLITHEHEDIHHQEVISGTLLYMSPEQTGRMNRAVDYRTDLYSLGVSLYEMLTGSPPFVADDAMQIIHGHIAKPPFPPGELRSGLPGVVSDLVQKLLSKAAEERYQNAFGLMFDLKRCREEFKKKSDIAPFPLAEHDVSLKLHMPQKLVGREEKLAALTQCYERMVDRERPEMITVSGYSGIGKSALVQELYKEVVGSGGYFISGAYEQFRRNVPYSSIIVAFSGLIRQLLAERQDRLESWRGRIQEALGSSGQVLTKVIPELELIIGEQPEVQELPPQQSQNRFNHIFANFVRVFSQRSHPLVLFLDDLQWADRASLRLVERLLTGMERGCLMLVGAYRSNELEQEHALNITLREIEKGGTRMEWLQLEPLPQESVQRLVADILRRDKDSVGSLAEAVYQKTGGNPFFVNQFMRTLYEKGLMEPDPQQGWIWDQNAIADLQVTDNVVDLMAEKIAHMPYPAQRILMIGACIGNRFDLESLSVMEGESIASILKEMDPALEAGLIYFSGDMCYFFHDRIQQAAYRLMEEDKRSVVHYHIGWYMYNNTTAQDLSKNIFYIVNQLNAGQAALQEESERRELTLLNLRAGKKAKDTAAYQSSLLYFQSAIDLLEDDSCQKDYKLSLEIYTEAAKAAYLNASFAEMEEYIEIVKKHSSSMLDSIDVYEIEMQGCLARGRIQDAVETTYRVLAYLGVRLPTKSSAMRSAWELLITQQALKDKTDQELLNQPEMSNPFYRAAVRIATSSLLAFYVGGYSKETAILVFRMIRLYVRQGVCAQTPHWLASYTVVLFARDQMEQAFRFGDLALRLVQHTPSEEVKTRYIVMAMTMHWKYPLQDVSINLLNNYHNSMEVGNIDYACYSLLQYCTLTFDTGREKAEHFEETNSYINILSKYKQTVPYSLCMLLLQIMDNLRGHSEAPTKLSGSWYDENTMIPQISGYNDRVSLFLIYTYGMYLSYLFGNLEEARKKEEMAKNYLDASVGLYTFALFYFYRLLNKLARAPELGLSERKKEWKSIERSLGRLHLWSRHGPQNHGHKKDLVEAEIAGLESDVARAEELYEQAISGARENGFLHEEALAWELAGRFYFDRGLLDVAALYISRAIDRYSRWGAKAKVDQLREAWPDTLSRLRPQLAESRDPGTSSEGEGSRKLDLSSVIKASQAISGEIVLEDLLLRLMRIGIENIGAQRGALLLEKRGRLYIEAESDSLGKVRIRNSLPLEEDDNLPESIISYVYKTKENLVLNNAVSDERFSSDPYIRENRLKSVLCAPIRRKEEMSGLFYAENNLISNAFTQERLELLRVLSSQAAISLENAKLFEMARRDGLTHLINHRYFLYALEQEMEKARKESYPLSMLMVDIDLFKEVNDCYGHQVGDAVLEELGAIMRRYEADKDLVGRYGGEEFALIYPRADQKKAWQLGERIRSQIQDTTFAHGNGDVRITVSIGAAGYPTQASDSRGLIDAADRAMYYAKKQGRNRVCLVE